MACYYKFWHAALSQLEDVQLYYLMFKLKYYIFLYRYLHLCLQTLSLELD